MAVKLPKFKVLDCYQDVHGLLYRLPPGLGLGYEQCKGFTVYLVELCIVRECLL